MRNIIAFVKDERAATAIEYGLIAAGIAVIIIPVLTGVGSKLKTTFTTVQTALKWRKTRLLHRHTAIPALSRPASLCYRS